MIISREHKFIFLSNPKCASTTIRSIILPYSQITATTLKNHAEDPDAFKAHNPNVLHINAYLLKRSINKAVEMTDYVEAEDIVRFEDYYTFSTIRNPYKKVASWYFFTKPDKNFHGFGHKDYDIDSAFHHHFNDYISWQSEQESSRVLPNYEDFFTDPDTNEAIIPDEDIFKVEELDEKFLPRFQEKTGIDLLLKSVPRILPNYEEQNASVNLKWQGEIEDLYNENSKSYIEEHYSTDLSKFNYQFGQ